MHIPDGLMHPLVLAIGWIIAIVFIWIAVALVNKKVDNRHIPVMAVLAAGIFVAQMLNFPIGGGTTGHLVGAALAVVLLGPYAGIIVLTTILIIQCLFFGDGGITALGLNVFNMGVVGCMVGWYIYRAFPKKYRANAGIFVAAWLSVFLAALACAGELGASFSLSGGSYGIRADIAIPVMAGYHTLIAFGEAIITTSVIIFITHVAPEMLRLPKIVFREMKVVS